MNYEIQLSSLESKSSEFENLKTSVDSFVRDINQVVRSLEKTELGNSYNKLNQSIERLKNGYDKCDEWLNSYIRDLKTLESSLAELKGKTIEAPTEFQGEFIDMFGKKIMSRLKTGADQYANRAEELRLAAGLTESDSWFFDEQNYVDAMVAKANKYYGTDVSSSITGARHLSKDNNWFVMVDADYCRIMYFENVDGAWTPVTGQSCEVGCRGIEASQRSDIKWWADKGAVRSCTFKGVFQVDHKHDLDTYGMHGGLCYVKSSPDDCQRIHGLCQLKDPSEVTIPTDETWNDNIDYLNSSFASLGCVCVRDATAEWGWNNIPVGTDIVIFDRWNPTPGLGGANQALYNSGNQDGFEMWTGDSSNIPQRPEY